MNKLCRGDGKRHDLGYTESQKKWIHPNRRKPVTKFNNQKARGGRYLAHQWDTAEWIDHHGLGTRGVGHLFPKIKMACPVCKRKVQIRIMEHEGLIRWDIPPHVSKRDKKKPKRQTRDTRVRRRS